MIREPVLVSACLLGLPTRYDGKTKRKQNVLDYLNRRNLLPIPICPEQAAGLPTPRERTFFTKGDGHCVLDNNGIVVSETGENMNDMFCRGARFVLQVARLSHCKCAILKERSPSCGVHQIYHHDSKISGQGVTAALLLQEGLTILSEEEL